MYGLAPDTFILFLPDFIGFWFPLVFPGTPGQGHTQIQGSLFQVFPGGHSLSRV